MESYHISSFLHAAFDRLKWKRGVTCCFYDISNFTFIHDRFDFTSRPFKVRTVTAINALEIKELYGAPDILNFLSLKTEGIITFFLALFCGYELTVTLINNWGFTTDDAYISWVYARQLINGNGLSWHTNLPRVEGYSNFLWIIIASLIMKFKLPLVFSMKLISCLSLGAGLIFLYNLGRLFFGPLLAILPVLIFSHYLGVSWWTVSGLESMFYCALSIGLVWQCMVAFGYHKIRVEASKSEGQHLSTRSWIITNIVLLLLCLTRFEGVIWSVPLMLFIGFHLQKYGLRTVFPERKTLMRWGFITLVCFLLPYAIYFIWRLNYFGHLIPNSYSCKALASGEIFTVDFDYFLIIFPFIIASLPYFLSSKDSRHWLLWSPTVLYAMLLWEANPVIAHFSRLFLGPMALSTVLPVLGIKCFLDYFKHYPIDPKLITAFGVFLLTLLFIPGNDPQYLKALLRQYHERTQIRLTIAETLNNQAVKGSTVLLGDCGLIPFTARVDMRFLDIDCLNNPDLTTAPYKDNLNLYGRHIALTVKPEWVVAAHDPSRHQENPLFNVLRQMDFFDDYKLVTILQAGWINEEASGHHQKTIDYVYQVYKRHPSYLPK